ncbi:MAG: N-acetylmuramoyl-L-alanine amidase [Clostridia bacterium]
MDQRALLYLKKNGLWLVGCLLMIGIAWRMQPVMPVRQTEAMVSAGPLSGHILAVDAGHGGYDGGARGPGGRWEKVYNLEVAQKLRDGLQAQGAQVIMTRNADYALCDAHPKMRKKRQDMERRAALILDGGAEMVLSIHMNEYRNTRTSGPQVFYRKDCAAGAMLATVLQRALVEQLQPSKAREASVGDFYIVSLGIPSVLIECGFLSNAQEAALLQTPDYQQRVADAVICGVIDWFVQPVRPTPAPREAR